jgi:hypothetical protein
LDEDIKKIIEEFFTVKDSTVIEEMLEVVNNNISDSQKGKRTNYLDNIIRSVVND